MAAININVGTAANSNDGATLRDAFINVRKMMYEIYGISTNASDVLDSYTDALDLSTGTPTFAESVQDIVGAMFTSNTETNITATYEDSDGTIDLAVSADLDSIGAGDGLTGTSLTSGDPVLNVVGGDGITSSADEIEVTVDDSTIELSATNGSGAVRIKDLGVATGKIANDAVNGDKIADDSINSEHYVDGSIDTGHIADLQVTTAKIAADSVTNAKLGVEYTASVALSSGTAVAVDTALGDIFTMTAAHSHTFNFTNVVVGDVKTLEITGSGGSLTSAFGTSNGASATFNKIGGTYSDAAAKQIIQIKWTAVNNAWYQISQIAS